MKTPIIIKKIAGNSYSMPTHLSGDKLSDDMYVFSPKDQEWGDSLGIGNANMTYDWKDTSPNKIRNKYRNRKIIGGTVGTMGALLTAAALTGEEGGGLILPGLAAIGFGVSKLFPKKGEKDMKKFLAENQGLSDAGTHTLKRGKLKSMSFS